MAENITTILDKAELTDSQASDKFYVMRGTGSDRDRNSTLATILAGTPFATAVKALRDENGGSWKVFTPANGTIDTGTWAQNSIVQMQAWADAITNTGATIKNAVMILIPRWGTVGTAATATSCTFQHAFSGAPDITITIPAGNIAVISFGSSGGVQEYHCIPSSNSAITAAIFKSLTVSGTLSLPVGSIIPEMLATKCVTTSKLDDLAVSSSNLGTKAVITNKIDDGAVTTVKLDHTSGSEAVDETAIQTGAVTKTKLGDAAVTEEKLHNDAVTNAKIMNAAVTTDKLANASVTLSKINASVYSLESVDAFKMLDDAAAVGCKRLLYNSGSSDRIVRILYLANSTDTVATANDIRLPVGSAMEFVSMGVMSNDAGTFSVNVWRHVV